MIQSAFNAGELSPFLEGRLDIPQRARGCRELTNMLPMVEGPAQLRPGTESLGHTFESGSRSWLMRFVRGPRDSYIIEASDFHFRFWRDGSRVVQSTGLPVEIETPWSAADLVSEDGTCALATAQAGDQLWIVHRSGRFAPRILQRFGLNSFTLSVFEPEGGPWAEENATTATMSVASATSPTQILAQSTVVLSAAHVGSLIRLFPRDGLDRRPWEANRAYSNGDIRWSDGHAYVASDVSGDSGAVKPVHTRGIQSDKGTDNGGAKWTYLHSGYGIARITSAGPVGAIIRLLAEYPGGPIRMPEDVVEANLTPRWQLGAWSDVFGWPTAVAFAFGRLWMARGRRIWSSRTDDFFRWNDRTTGQILADDGLSALLIGDGINITHWMLEHPQGLLVGTDGGVFLLRKSNESQVLGAVTDGTRNIQWTQQPMGGTWALQPERVAGRATMVDASGRAVYLLGYDLQSNGLVAEDLSVLASHMLVPGIAWMAWQGGTDRVLWVGLANGRMAALSLAAEQEVSAWSRHVMAGGTVEAGITVPRTDGDGDDLYVIVRRVTGSTVHRTVERMARRWRKGDELAKGVFLDGAVKTELAGATGVDGLDHIEGATVALMRDGVIEADKVVDGGAVTADRPAATAIVAGLRYEGRLRPILARQGGLRPKGRAPRASVMVIDTNDLRLGVASQPGQSSELRSAGLDMLQPLLTGVHDMTIPSEHERVPDLLLTATGPYPATVVAIEPHWT